MSNVPSIFSAPPGQGGNNSSNNNNNGYTPSAAASGYTGTSAGGYTPSAAASGYTPSTAASGYTPSAAAGGYTPSAAAGGYTPSASAGGSHGGGYTPSSAANSYTPSAAASGYSSGGTYTPSSAASGGYSAATGSTNYGGTSNQNTGGYVPSATAMSYNPSAAAGGPVQSGNTSNTGGYVPSTAATSYTPSTAATSYTPSSAATASSVPVSAPAPAFNQAINAPTNRAPAYPPSAPPAYKDPNVAPSYQTLSSSPIPHVTATPANPFTSSFSHGGGPTQGVMSQAHDPVNCHKIDYEIKGQEMQLVEVHLDPQETAIAEAGAMMYLEDDIDFKTKFGDGSEPKQGFFKKLMAGAGRLLTGESLFITHFTNTGSTPARKAAFAAPYPGTILPIDMMELQQRFPSGMPDKPTSIICQRDAFLCAAKGTKLEMYLHKKLGSGLFGGEGFILQQLKGDGMAFCHAGGCVIRRELKYGEKLRVDTGCLVAYSNPGINNDIQMAPGLKTMFFGGEGLFLCTLTADQPQGGVVWLQSLPFSRLCDRILANAPSAGGSRTGEGNRLTGGLGDLIDGDNNGLFGF
ncbi:Pfam:DUF124 [Seminavis robusta]|uniref:Pfam:DUF124 n=1 Tax=Seminavis robusta TaxID=568900 RepID=A0A9N8ESX2_9STRA|nr:Pfam:DUF124 [Seminavis robusta]|eukprot:Sro1679_g290670.1 Pfam:DUF124 (576) ;mRNA; f:6229-8159